MKWALITGASSGIGRCYTMELARRKYNIILVSNQEQQLEEVALELRSKHNIETATMCIDLTHQNAAQQIFERCQHEGWQVEVLICNAGMLLFSTLTNTPAERLEKIIALHCTTTTMLCRYFGQEMKLRNKGHILIMSSATAWLPYPTISHYGATKAYIKNFAFALWYELRHHGVSVTTIFPGAVDTPFYNLSPRLRKFFRAMGIMLSPEAIARRGVRAMFWGCRRLTPGLFTKLVVGICSLLPARLFVLLLRIGPIRRLLAKI